MRAAIALSGMLSATAAAQTDRPKADNLEFRLQVDPIASGPPRAFRLILLNKTGHDVYVPLPAQDCTDDYDGHIDIVRNFKPLRAKDRAPAVGHGCALCQGTWPLITDRIQENQWKILHAGDALALNADHVDPRYPWRAQWEIVSAGSSSLQAGMEPFRDGSEPGTYEFWAAYSPPRILPPEQSVLDRLHIDYPRAKLTTNHLRFVKRK